MSQLYVMLRERVSGKNAIDSKTKQPMAYYENMEPNNSFFPMAVLCRWSIKTIKTHKYKYYRLLMIYHSVYSIHSFEYNVPNSSKFTGRYVPHEILKCVIFQYGSIKTQCTCFSVFILIAIFIILFFVWKDMWFEKLMPFPE